LSITKINLLYKLSVISDDFERKEKLWTKFENKYRCKKEKTTNKSSYTIFSSCVDIASS